MENIISITLTAFGITHNATLLEECSADELIETFANLTESIGFSPSSVIKALDKAIDSRL